MSCGCTFSTGLETVKFVRNIKAAAARSADAAAVAAALTPELLRSLPKAHLHCHLDGCVRPQTLVELARELGIT